MLSRESVLRKDKATGKGLVFQHRHFAAIAAIICEGWPGDPARRKDVAQRFANNLADTNPNFDRARFLRACGVEV